MHKWFKKHRLLTITTLIVLVLLAIYPTHIILIHRNNTKHARVWEALKSHARENGIAFKPVPDPNIDRIHFYDDAKTFRSRSGFTSNYQGYRDSTGTIVLPSIYKHADQKFCEGLAYVVLHTNTGVFIHPDGTIAFKASYDYVSPFVNGMAQVRNELPSRLTTPMIRTGFINKSGELVVPIQYEDSRSNHFIGDHTLVYERTIYSPIYDNLMNGIDISLGLEHFFPTRLRFIDNNGNTVSPAQVRLSFE